jgi:hypothetical protein
LQSHIPDQARVRGHVQRHYALIFVFAFCAAHRRFTAAAICARSSGESFRFFLVDLGASGVPAFFLGLPLRTAGEPLMGLEPVINFA